MNAHTRKTIESITTGKAPRDLDWNKFISMWEAIADKVENESGDRLSVTMNGHREVFRRPHNGVVSIEDIERARHLLKDTPKLKGEGHGYAVAIDAKGARLYDFDFAEVTTDDTEHTARDHDARAHHLRTVERKTGRDDEADLKGFFDELGDELVTAFGANRVVVLGHGAGKANVAQQFVERYAEKHAANAALVTVVDLDLSAASDTDIENAVEAALGE